MEAPSKGGMLAPWHKGLRGEEWVLLGIKLDSYIKCVCIKQSKRQCMQMRNTSGAAVVW